MTVERHVLLLSVRRVFGGVDIHDETLLLLSPYERVVGSPHSVFEDLQSGLSPQNLILKPR